VIPSFAASDTDLKYKPVMFVRTGSPREGVCSQTFGRNKSMVCRASAEKNWTVWGMSFRGQPLGVRLGKRCVIGPPEASYHQNKPEKRRRRGKSNTLGLKTGVEKVLSSIRTRCVDCGIRETARKESRW